MLVFTAHRVNKNAVNSVRRNDIAILRRVTVEGVVKVAGKVPKMSRRQGNFCAFHI